MKRPYLFFAFTFIFFLQQASPVFAAISIDPSALQLPSSVDEVISKLPAPLQDFVQSIKERFREGQFSMSDPVGSSTSIRVPQEFSVSEILRLIKEGIIFFGGFAVVILRVVVGFIESVIRWTQSLL